VPQCYRLQEEEHRAAVSSALSLSLSLTRMRSALPCAAAVQERVRDALELEISQIMAGK
jgi:hypothetical protein